MSVLVTIYLGPGLYSSRQVTITRMPRAGDDTMPSATVDETLAGDVESVTAVLPANQIWQLK